MRVSSEQMRTAAEEAFGSSVARLDFERAESAALVAFFLRDLGQVTEDADEEANR